MHCSFATTQVPYAIHGERQVVHSVISISFLVNILDLRLFCEVSDHPHAMHRNHKYVAQIAYFQRGHLNPSF